MSYPQDVQIIYTWPWSQYWFLFGEYYSKEAAKPFYGGSHCYQLPAKDMAEELREYRNLWGQDKKLDDLQTFFGSYHETLDKTPISKIVCVAFGSPSLKRLLPKADATSYANMTWSTGTHHRLSNESMQQLIFLERVQAALLGRHNIKEVCFQDSGLNQVDRDFIQNLGYSIIGDPEPQNWMTRDTLLFAPSTLRFVNTEDGKMLAPSANVNLVARCFEQCCPGLYIGTDPVVMASTLDMEQKHIKQAKLELEKTVMKWTDMEKTEMKQTFANFLEATRTRGMNLNRHRLDDDMWERFATISSPAETNFK